MIDNECATTSTPPAREVPAIHREYENNQARFTDFYAVQKAFVACLAHLPALVRVWLDSLPPREEGGGEEASASKSWRAARLSAARRRELSALIANADVNSDAAGPLAEFLLKSLPVETYFAIADAARPSLLALHAKAHQIYHELAQKRNDLFAANYGLAKSAVRGKRNYDELLSASSCGLLAAIDRYVPEGKAARFGYFANFWIRYHISRYGQKNGGIVPLSINQQRIVRKIERYLAERRTNGQPVPTALEVCSDLKISAEAYYWYQQRPVMISLDTFGQEENADGELARGLDNLIAAPAPDPNRELENTEIGIYARELLRKNVPSSQRVMISYLRRIGSLVDAVEHYLADVEVQVLDDLRAKAAIALRSSFAPPRHE